MKKQQVINTNYRNFQHISSPRLKVLFFHDFCSTIWQEKTNRFKHTFSEFIESLSWPLKQRTSSHSASTFVALTNRSWIGSLMMLSLAVGLKDSCLRLPHRTVSTSSRHEGGHLHPHRPRRSNVLVFHVWFSWVKDPSRLIQQQQGCCERTRINIRQQVTYFVWGFASTLICRYYMCRYMEACPNFVWSVQHYITTGGGTLKHSQSDSSLFV